MKRSKFPAREIIKGATKVFTVREIEKKFKLSRKTIYKVLKDEPVSNKTKDKIRNTFNRNKHLSTSGYRLNKKVNIKLKSKGINLIENYPKVYISMSGLLKKAFKSLPKSKKARAGAYFKFVAKVEDKYGNVDERATKSVWFSLKDTINDEENMFKKTWKGFEQSQIEKVILIYLQLVYGGRAYEGRSNRLRGERLE